MYDFRLTSLDYWIGAGITLFLSVVVSAPLILVFRDADFRRAAWAVTLSSGLFWGVVATLSILGFWELYYQHFYPGWVRWLAPLDALLYAAIGLGMWWIATHLPGPSVLWFILLGSCESIIEHLFGIYALGILSKVPLLQGVSPASALTFAFFEYAVYWAIVGWMAFGIFKIGLAIRGAP